MTSERKPAYAIHSVFTDGLPDFLIPKADPACEAGIIGGNADIVRQIIGADIGGISSAEIQRVVVQEGMDDLDRIPHAAIPLFEPARAAGFGTDVAVIGLIFVNWMMRELEVRRERAIGEHRAPDTRAESEHDFKPAPRDNPKALHLRIIEEASRFPKALC